MMESAKKIGKVLQQLRLARNESQKDAAFEAGVSLSSLQRLEDGSNVGLHVLMAMLDYYQHSEAVITLLSPADTLSPLAYEASSQRAQKKQARRRRASSKTQLASVIPSKPPVWPEDKQDD